MMLIATLILAQVGGGWSDTTVLPANASLDAGVVAVDSDTLYFLPGGNSSSLFRYVISTNVWTEKILPVAIGAGGGIVHRSGSSLLYIAAGGGTTDFHEFDTANDGIRPIAPLPALPASSPCYAATGSKVYYLLHDSPPWPTPARTALYEFSPSPTGPGAWVGLANAPASNGAKAFVYPGTGDHLFAVRGGGIADYTGTYGGATIWRYSISLNQWKSSDSEPDIVAPMPIHARSDMAVAGAGPVDAIHPQGSIYCISGDTWGWTSTQPPGTFLQVFNVATNEWSILAELPRIGDPTGSIAYPFSGDRVFIARGAGNDLWSYAASANDFATALPMAPDSIWEGGGVAATGDYLYVLSGFGPAGDGGLDFMRYSIVEQRWETLPPIAHMMGAGFNGAVSAAIAADEAGDVYALTQWFSGATSSLNVWKYSGSWTAMQPLSAGVGPGARLVAAGINHLFAIGRSHEYRDRYPDEHPNQQGLELHEFVGGEWIAHPLPAGEKFGAGASISCPPGRNLVYAMLGGNTPTFRAWSITGGTWSTLADLPAAVDSMGGALGYPGKGNFLYAFRGDSGEFWAYRMTDDSWSLRADAPGAPGAGSGLAGTAGGDYLYALQGGGSRMLWRFLPNASPSVEILGQYRMDGVTALAPGETTHEGRLIVKARIIDDNGYPVRLRAEVADAAASFDDSPTVTGGLLGGGDGSVDVPLTIAGLAVPADFRWQVQALNYRGAASAWIGFHGDGSDEAGEVDFATTPNLAPTAGGADQVRVANRNSIPVGARTFSLEGVMFEAVLDDENDDTARFEIEVRRMDEPFQGVATVSSALVAPGATATVVAFLGVDRYRWQYRSVDRLGLAGAWTAFGGNVDTLHDFDLQAGGSTGTAGCGQSAPGGATIWLALLAAVIPGRRRWIALLLALLPAAAHAQSGPREWSDAPSAPYDSVGGAVATDSDTVFVVSNATDIAFMRYRFSTGSWTRMANLVAEGGAMTRMAFHPGPAVGLTVGSQGFLYGLGASGTMNWYRYDVERNSWTGNSGLAGALPPYPTYKSSGVAIVPAQGMIYALGGTGNLYPSGASGGITFWRFNPNAYSGPIQNPNYPNGRHLGAWTQMASTPLPVGAGAALAYPGSGDYIYATRGGSAAAVPPDPALPQKDFWVYCISRNEWNVRSDGTSFDPADIPDGVSDAGSMTTDAAGRVYAATNDSLNGFYRYDPATNLWAAAGPKPGVIGGAVTRAGDTLVCLRGLGTRDIWLYSVSAGSFLSTLEPAPGPIGVGIAPAKVGGIDYLYALLGNDSTGFVRYSIPADAWTSDLAAPPAPVVSGAKMVHDGAGTLYVVRGGDANDFWSYSFATGEWAILPDLPIDMYSVRFLVKAGDGLYLVANSEKFMRRYSLTDLGWTETAEAPVAYYLERAAYPGSGDLIYAETFSGADRYLAYSMTAGTWNAKADGSAFSPLEGGSLGVTSTNVDGMIYGLGPSEFWSYSPIHDIWTTREATNGSAQDGAALAYPGSGSWLYATPGNSRLLWRYWLPPNAPPAPPFALAQQRLDGQAVGLNGVTPDTSIVLTMAATDPDLDFVAVEVEVRPTGTHFLNTSSVYTGSFPSGTPLSITIPNLTRGLAYHWQARSIDSMGKTSAWTSFGTMPELFNEADFHVRANAAPAAVSLLQAALPDGAPIATGQILLGVSDMRFAAQLDDPDGDDAYLEVQVASPAVNVDSADISQGEFVGDGGLAAVDLSLPLSSYRWRCRFVDQYGAAGPWADFGGNPDSEPDFILGDPTLPPPVAAPSSSGGGGGGCGGSASPVAAWLFPALAALLIPGVRRIL